MSFDNRVDTLTLEWIVPQVVDTVLRTNVFTTSMLSKTDKKFKAATMDFPIKFNTGGNITSFSGFDSLPTTATNTRVLMQYNPKFVAANIALPITDLAANNTVQKTIDLAEVECRSRAQDLADFLGTMFYGDGTGNGGKDMLGLTALVNDGTTVTTIGNLSRSTYPTLDGTLTAASSGLLTLLSLRTLYNAITDAGVQPTSIYAPFAVTALYESLLQPQERIMKDVQVAKNFKGFTGYKAMEFLGIPLLSDRKAPAGYLYMLNEEFMDFYVLPIPGEFGEEVPVRYEKIVGNQYNEAESMGFSWTGWIKSFNSFSVNSFVVLGGNLITDNPRRHGALTGITGV
jgi:hypothetical protein